MKRLLLIVPALFLLLTLPARALTAPKITVDSVTPAIPAIRMTGGTSVEIRDPAEELILLDAKGEPWLKMTGPAVLERTDKGWQEVRKENFYYLTETDVGNAVLERKQLPYPWRINGTYGGKPFVMEGTLVPPGAKTGDTSPGSGGSGWVMVLTLVAVLVLLVLLIRYRPRRT